MIASGKEILKYIPQRPPFVFVDKLISVDEKSIVSEFKIPDKNPLNDTFGVMAEAGLIENIAQTAAAGIGYKCISENKPVLPGFIGAVKKLEVNKDVEAGTIIKTTVTILNEVMNATVISGKVQANKEVIAECTMNIFIQEQ